MQEVDFELVTKPGRWSEVVETLRREKRLAVDLEANSMFAYRERICLIQISTPKQDYIIDPVAKLNLDELDRIMRDPTIEKIFHAAEYDIILMKREYQWAVANLFDTMWAARILGYRRYGLASLLEQFYGVKLNKRYQKSNWCQRPLTPQQLAYARLDTHYLFDLRDRLASELAQAGRVEEAAEIFAEQTEVVPSDNGFDPDSFWSINGAHDLSLRQQAVLKAASIFRDQEARRRDQPLFKVFSDRTLLELAQVSPRSAAQLSDVHGMSRRQMRRYGDQLLAIVEEAQRMKPPVYPRQRKRTAEAVLARYDRLHTWRKRRARARGVESDVIVSRDALWELAHRNPQRLQELEQMRNMGAWRRAAYGEEILQILRNSEAEN